MKAQAMLAEEETQQSIENTLPLGSICWEIERVGRMKAAFACTMCEGMQ